MTTLVTGAGGFIGGHLVADLLRQGESVRAVDRKPIDQWSQLHGAARNLTLDLSDEAAAIEATAGTRMVYNLAADMGGMGFIESHKADCMLSVLISTHVIDAARRAGVERYFYSSSACVYTAGLQTSTDVTALREEDAYPAMPEDGYGWEKLFSERMARHFYEDFGLETRVARYHNVYGPRGTYAGGREKAPAAICRKVAEAKLFGTDGIEIWGDGQQTRSFMYIDDCVMGTEMIASGGNREPVNLGSAELVSLNQLVDVIEDIAGVRLKRSYNLAAPQGVRGRNSDNALLERLYKWSPSIPLSSGLEKTFRWIFDEIATASGHA